METIASIDYTIPEAYNALCGVIRADKAIRSYEQSLHSALRQHLCKYIDYASQYVPSMHTWEFHSFACVRASDYMRDPFTDLHAIACGIVHINDSTIIDTILPNTFKLNSTFSYTYDKDLKRAFQIIERYTHTFAWGCFPQFRAGSKDIMTTSYFTIYAVNQANNHCQKELSEIQTTFRKNLLYVLRACKENLTNTIGFDKKENECVLAQFDLLEELISGHKKVWVNYTSKMITIANEFTTMKSSENKLRPIVDAYQAIERCALSTVI